MAAQKLIIQEGGVNVFVEVNKGVINIGTRRPIPALLTTLPTIDVKSVIGRSGDLQLLKDKINELQERQILQLFGVGGIGKTTLAKLFLQTYFQDYNHICWLEIGKSIKKTFASNSQLVDSLILSDEVKGKKVNDIFLLIIHRLGQLKGKNLLILDNVEQEVENESIYDAISLNSNWKTIVTSREELINYIPFETTPLTPENAKSLFYYNYNFDKNDSILDEILSQISYHTLTIEVVAKTSEIRMFNLSKVLEIVKKKPHLYQLAEKRELKFVDLRAY